MLQHTVNCRSVEKCVLRTEVFYHYFSMQPRNMQCTQFFNGSEIYCTVNCMSVEKCVLRTEVFYHYFSMQPRNMQCTQFFNGSEIYCTVNCMSVEKCVLRTEVFYHYFSMQPRNMQCTQFFNGHAIDCIHVPPSTSRASPAHTGSVLKVRFGSAHISWKKLISFKFNLLVFNRFKGEGLYAIFLKSYAISLLDLSSIDHTILLHSYFSFSIFAPCNLSLIYILLYSQYHLKIEFTPC